MSLGLGSDFSWPEEPQTLSFLAQFVHNYSDCVYEIIEVEWTDSI